MANPKQRKMTEEISLSRALELLNLHQTRGLSAASVAINVVRDPHHPEQIMAISLHEREVVLDNIR
jgi:hypothetical protein